MYLDWQSVHQPFGGFHEISQDSRSVGQRQHHEASRRKPSAPDGAMGAMWLKQVEPFRPHAALRHDPRRTLERIGGRKAEPV